MKEMTARIRMPTKREYAFIELNCEGSIKEIVDAHNELNEAYWKQSKKELPRRQWNEVLDAYRQGVPVQTKDFEEMSELQKEVIHELDKSDNRLKDN